MPNSIRCLKQLYNYCRCLIINSFRGSCIQKEVDQCKQDGCVRDVLHLFSDIEWVEPNHCSGDLSTSRCYIVLPCCEGIFPVGSVGSGGDCPAVVIACHRTSYRLVCGIPRALNALWNNVEFVSQCSSKAVAVGTSQKPSGCYHWEGSEYARFDPQPQWCVHNSGICKQVCSIE